MGKDGHPGVTPGVAVLVGVVRRRPTLPRGPPRSTIGAVGLSFRVRNGDRAFPRRYDRRNTMEISNPRPPPPHPSGGLGVGRSYLGNRTVDAQHILGVKLSAY